MTLPIGAIVMWYQSTASIPAGWALCDGANGTPDLRDKYVVGANADGEVGSPFGNPTHNHVNQNTQGAADHRHSATVTLNGDASSITAYAVPSDGYVAAHGLHTHQAAVNTGFSGPHPHAVQDTNPENNAPSFLQVHFIMKVA